MTVIQLPVRPADLTPLPRSYNAAVERAAYWARKAAEAKEAEAFLKRAEAEAAKA